LRFALGKLLTWSGLTSTIIAIGGLTIVTWVRHEVWYDDEPPPMWARHSMWLNLFESLLLIGLVAFGVWAIPRFAAKVR
jgi:hypothetical protein